MQKKMRALPQFVTVPEAASLLAISRTHGYRLVHQGVLPHLRLGRRVVVPIEALRLLLEEALDGAGINPPA